MQKIVLKGISVLFTTLLILSCFIPCMTVGTSMSKAVLTNPASLSGLNQTRVSGVNPTVRTDMEELASNVYPVGLQIQVTPTQTLKQRTDNLSVVYGTQTGLQPVVNEQSFQEKQIISLLDLQAQGIMQINTLMSNPPSSDFSDIQNDCREVMGRILYLKEKQKECEKILSDSGTEAVISPEKLHFYQSFNKIDKDTLALLEEVLIINYGIIKITTDYSKENTNDSFLILQDIFARLKVAEKISRDMEVHAKEIDPTYQKMTGKANSDALTISPGFFDKARVTYIALIDSLLHIMVIDALTGKDMEQELKEQMKDLLHNTEDLIPDFSPEGDDLLGDSGDEFGAIISGRSHHPESDVEKLLGGGTKDSGIFGELTVGLDFGNGGISTYSPYAGGTGSDKKDTTSKGSAQEWGIAIGTVAGGISGGAGGAAAGAMIGGAIGWIIDKIIVIFSSSSEKDTESTGKDTTKEGTDSAKDGKEEKKDTKEKSESSGAGDGGRTDQETGQTWGADRDWKDAKIKDGYSVGDTSDKSHTDEYLAIRQEIITWLMTPGKHGESGDEFQNEDSGMGMDTYRYTAEIQKIKDSEYTEKTGWDALPKWMKMISHPVDMN